MEWVVLAYLGCTLFLLISGNSHLSPGEIQTHREEEFSSCLSLLFIFRTFKGSLQILPWAIQSSAVQPGEKSRQPLPPAQASPALLTLAETLGLQESSPLGPRCCWSPPRRERSGKNNTASPLLVVHNSRRQLMGENLPNYSHLRTYMTEVSLGNLLGESLSSYSCLRANLGTLISKHTVLQEDYNRDVHHYGWTFWAAR